MLYVLPINEHKISDMLNKLINLNKNLTIYDANDQRAKRYGRALNYDFSKEIDYINQNTNMPTKGVKYHAHIDGAPCENVERNLFGTLPIQMGICYGFNSKLNGLEWHNGNETVVAITDTVLLVAHLNDMDGNTIHSDKVEGIYIKAGTGFEMFGTTMHLAPCKLNDDGFKTIIILPKGTNLPLECESDDELLFMTNKWLIVHPENERSISRGARVGIKGENIELKYK